MFDVTVHDLKNDRVYTETFDNVIVASGHFSTPNVPEFDGFDTFNGLYIYDTKLKFKKFSKAEVGMF